MASHDGVRETFADIGIPFPLFAAPVSEADQYRGISQCEMCQAPSRHCFSVHEGIAACYQCLRVGNAAIHKDTVVGCVGGVSVEKGLTDAIGISADELQPYGFDLIPHGKASDEPDWHHVRVPKEHLRELVRTPEFVTWQGCRWLFCCRAPMVYIGQWKEREFELFAGTQDPARVFTDVVADLTPNEFVWGEHADLEGCGGPYVFRCSSCGKHEGYCDMC